MAFFGFFENNDSLLLVPTPHLPKKVHGISMLLSDTGHNLIPISAGKGRKNDYENFPANQVEAEKVYDNLMSFASTGEHTEKDGNNYLVFNDSVPTFTSESLASEQNRLGSTPDARKITASAEAANGIEPESNSKTTNNINKSEEPKTVTIQPPPGLEDVREVDQIHDEEDLNKYTSTCKSCGMTQNQDTITPCITCGAPNCPKCHTTKGCRSCTHEHPLQYNDKDSMNDDDNVENLVLLTSRPRKNNIEHLATQRRRDQ